MKDYELTVVFHPDLEMNLDPAVDKVRKLIEGQGGKIVKEENDGKRRLSYRIRTNEFGIYYFFDVALPPEAPKKISSTLSISDEVMRYLLVKKEIKRVEKSSNEEAKEEENKANEEKGE